MYAPAAAPMRSGAAVRTRPALPLEVDRDKPSRRDAGERVLARLRRADEQRQLLLRAARREVRVAAENQRRGAVDPAELFRRNAELFVRLCRHVDARALDVDAPGA